MPLKRLAGDLLEFCYPKACAGCEDAYEAAGPLCSKCLIELEALESAPACSLCAAPLPEDEAPCQFCLSKGVPHYERVGRLGVFEGPLRELIHHIKYHNRWPLTKYLADQMMSRPQVREILSQADCIVAIPLHPLRQISRGYNQSELLARRLSRRGRIKLVHPIIRLHNTPTQTHLHSKAQRIENLRDAFGLIKPRSIRGKRVVVFDDVMTTGATLHAAAQTLLDAQPASLSALVVAVADPMHRGFQAV